MCVFVCVCMCENVCVCVRVFVSACVLVYLQSERIAEQAKGRELVHMLVEEKARRDFCLDRCKSDDKKMRYYTGFVTNGMSEACFNFLLPSVEEMRTWQGKRTSTNERTTDTSGPKSKLPLQEQFFMVMVRFQRMYS